jgi:hypothetical protein
VVTSLRECPIEEWVARENPENLGNLNIERGVMGVNKYWSNVHPASKNAPRCASGGSFNASLTKQFNAYVTVPR